MPGEDIVIRSVSESDAVAIRKIYAPYVKYTPVSFETEIPSLNEIETRILKTKDALPWLIGEIKHEIAGYAYAADHRSRSAYQWSKELSVYIEGKFRRKRIASALYTSIMDILKAQGVINALAGITLPNLESVAFHENFGFRQVGIYHRVGYKLNRFHDTGWYEYVITKNDRSPSNIIPVNEIRNSEKWLEAVRHGLSLIG